MLIILISIVVLLCGGKLHLCNAVPQAIIHIGPHKTASVHIQSVMYSLRNEMAREGYYWPVYPSNMSVTPKGLANFPNFIKTKEQQQKDEGKAILAFLKASVAQNRNIIMSCAEFDILSMSDLEDLKRHLRGYNVTIVFVYREVLSQMISQHAEENRFQQSLVTKSSSFSDYLFSIIDHLPLVLNAQEILRRYSKVFGAQNIRIIDLVGVVAQRRDVAQVLLCEIAGILCTRGELFPTDVPEKRAYDLVSAEVFTQMTLLISLNKRGKCKLCDTLGAEYNQFAARYNNITVSRPVVPILASNLTMLVPLAVEIDTDLRSKYSSSILYSNLTANLIAINQAHVEQLDTNQFISDANVMKWLQSEIDILRSEHRLCGC